MSSKNQLVCVAVFVIFLCITIRFRTSFLSDLNLKHV